MPRTDLSDLIGQPYGQLTVLELVSPPGARRAAYRCLCTCGTEHTVERRHLLDGGTQSCGCLRRTHRLKHGHARKTGQSPEFRSWVSMRQRCYDPNATQYPRYGGRGITVCDRWRGSFENFLADMGHKPTPKHTLERLDNDQSYSPEHCVWATRQAQARNRRSSRLITIGGVTKVMAQWADDAGISYGLLNLRVQRGVPEDCLLLPPQPTWRHRS